MKLSLDKVTLVCADTLQPGFAIASMRRSMEKVDFARCVLLTDVEISVDGIDVVQIPTLKSKEDYSKFIIYELYKYFDTDYCLIVQHDSWVLNADAWQDKFYNYDSLGACWLYVDGRNNSNGGFCLRSKKLQTILGTDSAIEMYSPEDEVVGRLYRQYLEEKHGIKYPTDDICDEFSFELKEPKCKTFGFHSYFHKPFKEAVVIRRKAALGDVVRVEPVLEYFYNNGYRVVLDTLPQFKELFFQHKFKVDFFDEFDSERIPYRLVNLDMSYESKPSQKHLLSYYDYAGVKDGEIKDATLNLHQDYRRGIKLFKKYCVIHIDNREQPYRNIYGINWETIVFYLQEIGYTVIQLGKDEYCKIKGALQMNTPSTQFLMWVVASSDLFIGIDSGISHIAVGFKIPSIIFFGSVDPNVIHANSNNKIFITNPDVCNTPFCWSSVVGGTGGKKCYIDEIKPPCTQFKNSQLINAINQIHEQNSVD